MSAKPQIGTISHGTLRTADLIEAFSEELKRLTGTHEANQQLLADAKNWLEQYGDEEDGAYPTACDEGNEIMCDIANRLSELALPGLYFGAHPGDGSDFGFWPEAELSEQYDMVAGGDEAKELGEPCFSVNDHGNITMYDGNGNVLWEAV